MRRYITIYLLFLFVGYVKPTSAQYILAGHHKTAWHFNYYHDVNDSILSSYTYLIDLNGDNTNDFSLIMFVSGGQGAKWRYVTIDAMNGNEIAFAYDDSCFTQSGQFWGLERLAKPFNFGDTIGKTQIWVKNSPNVHLAYYKHGGGIENPYYCSDNLFGGTAPTFLGVRAFAGNDTLYGWISVNNAVANTSTCVSSPELRPFEIREKPLNLNDHEKIKIYRKSDCFDIETV